jgi:hypothetical protein
MRDYVHRQTAILHAASASGTRAPAPAIPTPSTISVFHPPAQPLRRVFARFYPAAAGRNGDASKT